MTVRLLAEVRNLPYVEMTIKEKMKALRLQLLDELGREGPGQNIRAKSKQKV